MQPVNNLFEAIIINNHRTHGFFSLGKKMETISYFRTAPRGTVQKWGQMWFTFWNIWSLFDRNRDLQTHCWHKHHKHIYIYEYCIYYILNAIRANMVLKEWFWLFENLSVLTLCYKLWLNGSLALLIHKDWHGSCLFPIHLCSKRYRN